MTLKWRRIARGKYQTPDGRITIEQESYTGELGDWTADIDGEVVAWFRTKGHAQDFVGALVKYGAENA